VAGNNLIDKLRKDISMINIWYYGIKMYINGACRLLGIVIRRCWESSDHFFRNKEVVEKGMPKEKKGE
jgi:hypothetical protein